MDSMTSMRDPCQLDRQQHPLTGAQPDEIINICTMTLPRCRHNFHLNLQMFGSLHTVDGCEILHQLIDGKGVNIF